MKRILLILVAVSALLLSCKEAPKHLSFEILLTNDVHGRWFDEGYVDGEGPRNSLFAVNATVDSIRAAVGAEKVILIDAGDCLQGDNAAYYYNYVDTSATHLYTRLAAYMHYDAIAVGNHDIETGHPVYDRIRREMDASGIPFLAGNAVRESDRKPYFAPYTILEREGVRIAVLGYTNANIKEWLDERIWMGIDFESLLPLVQQDVDRVRETEHPDIVIVAVHSGTGEGDGSIYESQGLDLYNSLSGVDFLLCSHDHRPAVIASREGICLINSGSHARFLGHGTITLDLDGKGRIKGRHVSARLIPINPEKVDTAMRSAFREDYEAVKAFSLREVGHLSEELRTRDAYRGRALYTDFVHLVTLLSAREAGADISFAAPLTYNGTIPAGKLVYNDLFTLYPYENQLFVLEMTGQEIKDYLEYDYDRWIQDSPGAEDPLLRIVQKEDPRTGSVGWSFVNRSYNFDSAAGLNYTVDIHAPAGSRIRISSLAGGRPFEPGKTYRVAMTSYRANGGDLLVGGAGIPKEELEGRVVARLPELRELIYRFLLDSGGEISPALIQKHAGSLGDWKFVPETEAAEKMERDLSRLF